MEWNKKMISMINNKIQVGIKDIGQIYDNINWCDSRVYANWLAQTFYYTRHATRIISLAAAKTSFVHDEIHIQLIKHIEEEKGHEELARHDIKNLGYQLDQFPELPSTTAYYSTLYYLIEQLNSLCIFGYFSILEGLAVTTGSQLYEQVKMQFGANTATFLKVHCKADVKHFEDDIAILSQFSSEELSATHRSVDLSISLYKNLMNELIESHRQNTFSSAGSTELSSDSDTSYCRI